VLAGYLVLQGLNIIVRGVRTGSGLEEYGFPLIRGAAYIVFGAGMFLIGGSIIAALLFVGALIAILGGLIMIGYGFDDHTPEEAAALNTAGVFAIVAVWLNDRDLGPEKRTDVADTLYFEMPDRTHKLLSYGVMLSLSVAISGSAGRGRSPMSMSWKQL
jgi:hypothetical protein